MIYDPRSLDSWCINGSIESLFRWVLSVHHDLGDPAKWILIRIILKERTSSHSGEVWRAAEWHSLTRSYVKQNYHKINYH